MHYDGDCSLCDGAVRFITANDPAGRFTFVARPDLESVRLIDRDGTHDRSEAVLRIALWLRPPWPLLAVGYLLPRRWRDAVYDVIARNRHALRPTS